MLYQERLVSFESTFNFITQTKDNRMYLCLFNHYVLTTCDLYCDIDIDSSLL